MKYNLKLKKTALFSILFLLITNYYLLFTKTVYAVCPICTVAVGAGLGLSRWLGIDDTISGIWIGGLILSLSFWLIDWFDKKKFKTIQQFNNATISTIVIILMYGLVLLPLWWGKLIGNPFNTILGIDKILFGTIIGSIAFLFGKWSDTKIRKVKGRQLFEYQKVVLPIISLVLTSLTIYYYGGYLY